MAGYGPSFRERGFDILPAGKVMRACRNIPPFGIHLRINPLDLILSCVQSNINNPVETGEGLDEGWGGFELAQAVGQGVLDRVHRVIIVIAKGLPAHFPPDQFLGVALRAVSGQPIQGQVAWHHQRLGPMPACPIQ